MQPRITKSFGRLAQQRRNASSISAGGASDPTSYCRTLVQKHDYDSFLTSYFYPRHLQSGYFAIRAFNVELATVKEQTSNVALGRMRFQFWRDTMKQISENRPPQHPVALALAETIRQSGIPIYHLKRLIEARDDDLQNATHMTVNSLRTYAESTSSTTLYALLHLLSLSSSSSYSHAASHLGVAHSLTTLLRALPFLASQGTVAIPAEVTAKHGVSQEDVLRHGGEAKGITDAVYDLACTAKEELDLAREHSVEGGEKIPEDVLPIFLSGVPIANYLTRLEALNFDAFHPSLQKRDWKLPFQVWRARSKRMI